MVSLADSTARRRAQFRSFELRRGMHSADGGIVRLVNTCGVGIALEMELTGEPINAQCALAVNMVSKVVPHDELMAAAEDMVARILRNDRFGSETNVTSHRQFEAPPKHPTVAADDDRFVQAVKTTRDPSGKTVGKLPLRKAGTNIGPFSACALVQAGCT